ncbi:GGDEF domain-containing protein [Rhodopseudomonas palustris]|uniref:diguanylate cyclase n=1 Tax=Rhodopseudomonas palustris TaxID=1076 RepID=A0A323UKW5_RHOPL|nr:GGDEF domain-containing protein [Rhodopseudomonas palustris]PZA13265.1 GGDEF domain-containing protein [Rhodopseudomonas palustris]
MGRTAAISGALPDPQACADDARTLAVRGRRMRQRRRMLDLIIVSFMIDAAILLIYVQAGTIQPIVAVAFAVCGGVLVSILFALSESGFNDRFSDHYLTVPIAITHLVLIVGFAAWVPQIGAFFLFELFVLFGFAALRADRRQGLICWGALLCVLSPLFLLTDLPLSLPHQSLLERFATLLALVLTVGRCMFIGAFSKAMRDSLYKRGVQLREAYQRIEELAELDELTGAYNRRCVMRHLDNEIERAARHCEPMSLALIDLDLFKRINDTYGHPIGDEVLRTFAITIFANIRSFDRFGRYGGEEFLLMLPNTDQREAQQILERLRLIVAELDWSAFSPSMMVTLSAGVTTMTSAESADSVLSRADHALYEAKHGGRNRIAYA